MPDSARRDEVPAHIREANRLAAERDAAAPHASTWTAEQVDVLAELFGPRPNDVGRRGKRTNAGG